MVVHKFNAIGLDLDLTLANYDLLSLMEFTVGSQIDFLLREKNYPNDLKDLKLRNHLEMLARGTILDINKGIIMQLDRNGCVKSALKDGSSLDETDIISIYGPEKVPDFYKNELSSNYRSSKSFRIFDDYFTVQCVPLLNELFKCVIKYNLPKYPKDVWQDVFESFCYIYSDNSIFNQHFKAHVDKYIHQISDDLRSRLERLKDDKVLFLVTSSPKHYAEVVLNHIFSGNEWQKIFTYVIFDARKPDFFYKDNLFVSHDDMLETKVPTKGNMYSRGSHKILEEWLKCHVQNPQILYVGDSLQYDVFPISTKTSWNVCGIANEICTSIKFGKGQYWNSNLECHDGSHTLWYHLFSSGSEAIGKDLKEILIQKSS